MELSLRNEMKELEESAKQRLVEEMKLTRNEMDKKLRNEKNIYENQMKEMTMKQKINEAGNEIKILKADIELQKKN